MDEDAEYCLQFCYVIQYSESELQIHYYWWQFLPVSYTKDFWF
jgi:hypothetical protein